MGFNIVGLSNKLLDKISFLTIGSRVTKISFLTIGSRVTSGCL